MNFAVLVLFLRAEKALVAERAKLFLAEFFLKADFLNEAFLNVFLRAEAFVVRRAVVRFAKVFLVFFLVTLRFLGAAKRRFEVVLRVVLFLVLVRLRVFVGMICSTASACWRRRVESPSEHRPAW